MESVSHRIEPRAIYYSKHVLVRNEHVPATETHRSARAATRELLRWSCHTNLSRYVVV